MANVVTDRVIVELEAKIDRYNANVIKAEKQFQRSLDNMRRETTLFQDSMRGIGNGLRILAAAAIASFGVGKLIEMIDAGKGIEAQLRLATKEAGSFAQAQKDVNRIATETRSELEATAKLYANFVRNSRELGITQEQAARATETVTKAFKISGAGATESAQGIRQLTQALQSGVLRGDEFNTMMEGAPRLAKLLADSMNLPVKSLRGMAEQGKLTADALTNALTNRKFTESIDAEFKAMPVTFGEAMTLIENRAIQVFTEFDKGGQFSNAITGFVIDATQGFDDVGGSVQNFGRTVSSEFAGIIGVIKQLMDVLNGLGDLLDFQSLKATSRIADMTNAFGMAQMALQSLPSYQIAKFERERKLLFQSKTDTWWNSGKTWFGTDPNAKPLMRAPPTSKAGGGRKKTGGGGGGVDDAARIAEAQDRELARLGEEELRARLDLTTDAEERAIIQRELLEMERKELVRRLIASKAMTPEAQKLIDTLYGRPTTTGPDGEVTIPGKPSLLGERIQRDVDEERRKIENDMLGRQAETLDAWAAIETNTRERAKLAESALALRQKIQAAELEEEIAQGKVTDAIKARAELESRQTAERIGLTRESMGPLASYIDRLKTRQENIGEEVEGYVVDQLTEVQDSLVSGLQRVIGTKNPLIAGLLNLFIENVIMRPIAEALASQTGGGGGVGGFLGSVVGSIFGGFRAAGGPVQKGVSYTVGEHGRERFIPAQNGMVVPNHALSPGKAGTRVFNINVSADNSVTPAGFAKELSRDILREAQAMDARAAGMVVKQIPNRMAQYQRDGF